MYCPMMGRRSGDTKLSELGVALRFAEAGVAIIPVRVFRDGDRWRKRPHIKAWRERASTDPLVVGEWWQQWPEAVPGIVLAHSGLVVVDCDRHVGGADGVAAFAALGPFAAHPVVRTPSGGEHHYFRQPEPPIGGGPFGNGIDVLGTGQFVVAPGSAGYTLIEGGDTPALPEVFRKVGVAQRVALMRDRPGCVAKGEGNAVLAKLNPRNYREHGRWLRLMMACNAAGIEREAFIAWSIGDPLYAGDGGEIGERWDSLKAGGGITAETLFREARLDELNDWLDGPEHNEGPWHSTHTWQVPSKGGDQDGNGGAGETRNLKRRADYILRKVKDEPLLFWAACMFREIIAEGRLKPWIAVKLLEGAGRRIGLDLEACRRTIASAFLTVERKLKPLRYVLAPGALREWHGYGAKGRYQLAQEYGNGGA
jgi:Bifunctional DNA primase/polymerase, N-terminal/Primase C terminal 2 (PriCT-2)